MLSITIIEQIKKKSGLEFSNAKDFEVLSESFPANERLGVNTLKRLMGYAKSPIAPRKTTLDIVAHYLGFFLMGDTDGDATFGKRLGREGFLFRRNPRGQHRGSILATQPAHRLALHRREPIPGD